MWKFCPRFINTLTYICTVYVEVKLSKEEIIWKYYKWKSGYSEQQWYSLWNNNSKLVNEYVSAHTFFSSKYIILKYNSLVRMGWFDMAHA